MAKTNAVHKQYIKLYLKSLDFTFKMLMTEGKICVTQKYLCDFFPKIKSFRPYKLYNSTF